MVSGVREYFIFDLPRNNHPYIYFDISTRTTFSGLPAVFQRPSSSLPEISSVIQRVSSIIQRASRGFQRYPADIQRFPALSSGHPEVSSTLPVVFQQF
jgi:hypothetical protein